MGNGHEINHEGEDEPVVENENANLSVCKVNEGTFGNVSFGDAEELLGIEKVHGSGDRAGNNLNLLTLYGENQH